MDDDFLVPPPLGSGESPTLSKLGGLKFQALCRDVLDSGGDPQIRSCFEYGTNGQSQHGIDLVGERYDGGIDVIQCKAQEKFPPRDIRKASNEFIANVEIWKKQGVHRFLVLLGCEAKTTQQRKAIEDEKRRFKQIEIEYDVWASPRIVNKLRSHAGIVRQHLGNGWVDLICHQAPARVRIEATHAPNITGELTVFVVDATDRKLESLQELWRQGRRREVRRELAETRANMAVWLTLPPKTQAAYFRFEASITLDDDGDLLTAGKLLDEAQLLDHTPDDAILRAAMLWHSGETEEALSLLASPTTAKLRHFKALLLIQTSRSREAQNLLEEVAQPDAETFRLMSLCRLADGRVGEARLAIQKAREQSPSWISIQFISAVLDYFSALAPVVLPSSVPNWPEPVHPAFVFQDPEARGNLSKAHDQFVNILSISDLKTDERLCLESWAIASLALNPETRDQFEATVARVLSVRPTHHRAMAWAIAGGLKEITRSPAEAIRQLIIDRGGDLEQILTLVQFYAANQQFEKAASLLERTRLRFADHQARTIWLGWNALIKGRLGNLDEAISLAESVEDKFESRLLIARIYLASELRDSISARTFLDSAYRETSDPRFLLYLVELYARCSEWALASGRCEELLSKVQTTEVHELVVFCAFRAERFSLCLQLLHQGKSLYGSRLPSKLREMIVECQAQLGLLPAGLREAELLAEDEPTPHHLAVLAQFYISVGDSRSLRKVAQKFVSLDAVSANVLLHLATQVRWEDHTLAVDLWKKALSRGVGDEDVTTALLLGFELGLDGSVEELVRRMHALGQESRAGIKIATIDELVAHMDSFRKESKRLNEAYQEAAAPIHFIAPRLHLTLAEIYHSQLDANAIEVNLSSAPRVFIRNGDKPLPALDEVEKESFSIYADITAILTAHHYGFLEAVERTFAPIYISQLLIPNLLEIRDKLSRGQKRRHDSHAEILSYHVRQSIHKHHSVEFSLEGLPPQLDSSWAGLADAALRTNGYLVDFLPLIAAHSRIDPAILPNSIRDIVVGIGSVLRSLRTAGVLTADRLHELMQMSSLQTESPSVEPRVGSNLYFRGSTIEVFATAGLLNALTAHFSVFVEDSELVRLQTELDDYKRRQDLATWTTNLIQYLNDGIINGNFKVASSEDLEPIADINLDDSDITMQSFLALVRMRNQCAGKAWIDDRYGNRHVAIGAMPITDSLLILQQLLAHGTISKSQYFETVVRMRAEGAMFIPTSSEEILHHVSSAPSTSVGMETSGLRMLRRGIAASFLSTQFLNSSASDEGTSKLGEQAFVRSSLFAISQACGEICCSSGLAWEESIERVSWVLNQLFLPRHVAPMLSSKQSDGNDSYIFAIEAASLFLRGASTVSGQDTAIARSYNEWLYEDRYRRRFLLEPTLLQQTAEYVKKILNPSIDMRYTEEERRAVMVVAGRHFLSMPMAIQRFLGKDEDFLRPFGIKVTERTIVGDLEFDHSEYLAAASAAVNGRTGMAVASGLGGSVQFLPSEDGESIELSHPSFSSCRILRDWRLLLLAESPSRREHAIEIARNALDVPYRFQDSLSAMASTEDISLRLDKADELRAASLPMFYEELADKLATQNHFRDIDLFPSNYTALTRHLRLDISAESTVNLDWGSAIQDLRHSLPLLDQLDRLFRLPIELPADLLENVRGLGESEKRALSLSLLTRVGGPLWRIQYQRMSQACFDVKEEFFCVLEQAAPQRIKECSSYLSLVRWVYDKLVAFKEQLTWPDSALVAVSWMHGDHLFSILHSLGHSFDWIESHFSAPACRVASILFHGRDYLPLDRDVANPHNVTPEVLWACGYSGLRDDSRTVSRLIRVDVENVALPHPSLIPSVVDAPNELSSILGADRLESFIQLTGSQSVTPDSIRADFEQFIITTLPYGNRNGLLFVHFFSDSSSLSGECSAIIRAALRTWVFVKSDQGGDLEDISRDLYILALLLRWANDTNASEHITAQFRLVISEAKNRGTIELNRFLTYMLEVALLLAQLEDPGSQRISRFCELAETILIELPRSARVIRSVVVPLSDDLPFNQTEDVWRLILRLRAHSEVGD